MIPPVLPQLYIYSPTKKTSILNVSYAILKIYSYYTAFQIMGVRRIFSRGGNIHILLILFGLLTMQCKKTFTKRFTISRPKENALFYSNSRKHCVLLA